MPYVFKRLLYALRCALVGLCVGWKVHKQIHGLALTTRTAEAGWSLPPDPGVWEVRYEQKRIRPRRP